MAVLVSARIRQRKKKDRCSGTTDYARRAEREEFENCLAYLNINRMALDQSGHGRTQAREEEGRLAARVAAWCWVLRL
jgi:hypothetical protein